GLRLVLTRNDYAVRAGDPRAESAGEDLRDVLFEGKYRLDPTATPKAIDIVASAGDNRGETARGIYPGTGDTLEVCYTVGRERPGAFRSPKGSGIFLAVWKRTQP